MSEYRLHVLNAAGETTRVVELHCRSDAEAMGEMRGLQTTEATELWQRDRRVGAFPADRPSTPDSQIPL